MPNYIGFWQCTIIILVFYLSRTIISENIPVSPSGIVLYDNNYLKCIYRRVVLLLIVRIHIDNARDKKLGFFSISQRSSNVIWCSESLYNVLEVVNLKYYMNVGLYVVKGKGAIYIKHARQQIDLTPDSLRYLPIPYTRKYALCHLSPYLPAGGALPCDWFDCWCSIVVRRGEYSVWHTRFSNGFDSEHCYFFHVIVHQQQDGVHAINQYPPLGHQSRKRPIPFFLIFDNPALKVFNEGAVTMQSCSLFQTVTIPLEKKYCRHRFVDFNECPTVIPELFSFKKVSSRSQDRPVVIL